MGPASQTMEPSLITSPKAPRIIFSGSTPEPCWCSHVFIGVSDLYTYHMGGFGEDPIEAAEIEFEGKSKATESKAKAAARRLSKPTMQTDSAGAAAAATE